MTESPVPMTDPSGWLDQYGNYLYRYAMYRLGNPDTAEELVQETFIAALKSRENFSGKSSERTWLVGILKHKIIDHLRKIYRERALVEELGTDVTLEGEFRSDGHWADGPQKWDTDPMEVINQKQFWETLQSCLEGLPKETAQAYVLREVDGLSSEEICKVMNITPNNLWVRLHRARMGLRRCLEKNWFGRDNV
ncbi:MAG: sigma-70 family RNA polymerase sigma factor [Candidatus Lernaella stagnicola]|nr:sigma-70 family RNA polymerase sigma factor [Candidatus Lernaella stagnicola]